VSADGEPRTVNDPSRRKSGAGQPTTSSFPLPVAAAIFESFEFLD
jgi:hypothetical protein